MESVISVTPSGCIEEKKMSDRTVELTKRITDTHKSAPELDHPDGSVTSRKLAYGAVTTVSIREDAVTAEKIADKAVTADKLAPESISKNLFDYDLKMSSEEWSMGYSLAQSCLAKTDILESKQDRHGERISKLETDFTEIENTLDAQKSDITTSRTDITALQTDTAAMREEIEELQTETETDTDVTAATVSIEHNKNRVYTNTGFAQLEVTLPETAELGCISGITFVCGSDTFNFITPDTVKYKGTDCIDGVFVPVNVGDSYDLIYEYNGIEWKCYVG